MLFIIVGCSNSSAPKAEVKNNYNFNQKNVLGNMVYYISDNLTSYGDTQSPYRYFSKEDNIIVVVYGSRLSGDGPDWTNDEVFDYSYKELYTEEYNFDNAKVEVTKINGYPVKKYEKTFSDCFGTFATIICSKDQFLNVFVYVGDSRFNDYADSFLKTIRYDESINYQPEEKPSVASDIASLSSTKKNMGINEIAEVKDNVYIGLRCARISDYAKTSRDSKEYPQKGYKVLEMFYEVLNDSNSTYYIDNSNFTCYADSTSIGNLDSILSFYENSIKADTYYFLDSSCKTFVLGIYQIPEDASTIDAFVSNCNWHINISDISDSYFDINQSLYNYIPDRSIDIPGSTVLQSDKFDIYFDGVITKPAKYEAGPYVIFEYTLTNKTDNPINMSLIGYKMRVYRNNYYVGTPAIGVAFGKNIDGYTDIYYVEEVQSGMSYKFYVAFEVEKTNGEFMNVLDFGYVGNEIIGYINTFVN